MKRRVYTGIAIWIILTIITIFIYITAFYPKALEFNLKYENAKPAINDPDLELSKQDIAYKNVEKNGIGGVDLKEVLTYSQIPFNTFMPFINSTKLITLNLPVKVVRWYGKSEGMGHSAPSATIFIRDSKIIASIFCGDYFIDDCRDFCTEENCKSMHEINESESNLTFPEFTKPENWKYNYVDKYGYPYDCEENKGYLSHNFPQTPYYNCSPNIIYPSNATFSLGIKRIGMISYNFNYPSFGFSFIIGGIYNHSLSQDELKEILYKEVETEGSNFTVEKTFSSLILDKYEILKIKYSYLEYYFSAIYCESNNRVYILKFSLNDKSANEEEIVDGLLNIKCPTS